MGDLLFRMRVALTHKGITARPDYFEGWTEDQLSFARAWGETLSCVREFRYCDPETGGVR